MRRAVAALAVLLALVTSGCGGVPDSGSVHLGRVLPGVGGLDDEDIKALPAPPRPDMSPTAVVRGFLRSLVYSDGGYGVARAYLATGTPWRAGSAVTTYDETRLRLTRSGNIVRLWAPRVGVVDPRGEYSVAPGAVRIRYTMVREDGQWRIAELPPGLILSTFDAQRSLQPATIYFLNQQQDRVVPVQLLVNVQQTGLATTLVRALLAGPAPAQATVLRSAAPPGTQLLGNVPVDDNGVAEVDLPLTVRQLPADQLTRLSAQLSWTLRQLAGVTAVRLLADGSPLAGAGVPSLQPTSSWPSFDPDPPPVVPGALAVRGERVVGVGGHPPAGLTGHGFSNPVLSQDASRAAAVRRGAHRSSLWVGPSTGPLRRVLTSSRMSPPAFDAAGNVLTAISGPLGGSIVLLPQIGGKPVPLAVPAGAVSRDIDAVRVSPDGSRIAIVSGPAGARALLVGLLRPTRASYAVTRLVTLVNARRDVSGVGWARADELITTVATRPGHRVVLEVDVDGYQRSALSDRGAPARPTQVAAAPGRPTLVCSGGEIWRQSQLSWRRVSTGGDPSYPG